MYIDNSNFFDFKNMEDVEIKLLHFWKDETLLIKSYDKKTSHIAFNKTSTMRINKNDRFFLQNVFETLNKPGQWYLDKTEGVLYVIPNESDTPENYTVSPSTVLTEFPLKTFSFVPTDFFISPSVNSLRRHTM